MTGSDVIRHLVLWFGRRMTLLLIRATRCLVAMSMIDLASWLGSRGRLGWSVIQSLRQFQPLLATLGDALSDCSHNVFCLALREVFGCP